MHAPRWSGHLWLVVDRGVELAGTGHLDPVPLDGDEVIALVRAAAGEVPLEQLAPDLRAALELRGWSAGAPARGHWAGASAGALPADPRPIVVHVDGGGPSAYDHERGEVVAVDLADLASVAGETPVPIGRIVGDSDGARTTGGGDLRPIEPPPPVEAGATSGARSDGATTGPVPVWFATCAHRADGNPLALGMVRSAVVHHEGGRLLDAYDARPITVTAEDLRADVCAVGRPGVVLMSNYLWTVEANLALAAEIKALHPEALVVFGGPSAPKYEGDAAAFLASHPQVDVLARGEGEPIAPSLLAALSGDLRGWQARLASVPGLTFRGPDGPVRTADGERLTDLDVVPSPYLTGMFDHLADHGGIWSIETNRGCPYGCTFCDWGSATLSRVRRFSMDRISGELEWIASRGIDAVFFADANFGMFTRDLDVARRLAELRRTHGSPRSVMATWAKNTTKHSLPIIAELRSAGIEAEVVMSFQTVDEPTLRIIDRKNLLPRIYPEMAQQASDAGLPLISEFMVGLPGSTMESLRGDVQTIIEAGTSARFFGTVLLPNSPMNDPEYRRRHQIVTDDQMQVIATASFTARDREDMIQFLDFFRAADHFGVLREVMRFAAHEAEVREVDVLWELYLAGLEQGDRYPLLGWFVSSFRRYVTVPMGWSPFLADVARALVDRGLVSDGDDLRTVLAVQEAVLPAPGRSFPDAIQMAHDYPAYRSQRQEGAERRPLRSFGPATMVVEDPDGRCLAFTAMEDISFTSSGSRQMIDNGVFWAGGHWELDSPIRRALRGPYLAFPPPAWA